MKKMIQTVLFGLMTLFLLTPFSISAASALVVDEAGLLSSEEAAQIEQEAQRIAGKYDTNVLFVTSLQNGYSDNYARDLIEDYGVEHFPEGYVAYMIDMADRSYWVDVYGERERSIFRQSDTDKLAENSLDDLKDGDYYGAAREFLKGVDIRLDIKTSPMGVFKKPLIYKGWTIAFLMGSGVLALLAAGGWTYAKASRHKDKGLAVSAAQYQQPLSLRNHHDRFVRSYQTRVKVPESSGSSGGGFGGGGGGGHTGSGGHF